ncbi:chemotaxis protein CheY [Herbiconiux sp. CPCC 203407]|uniref:Chemotaxis protein CheY n=1 Tax=Herbiconiux oxytropis TaxID=2970915 RepID=A0AA41XH02_9MICO|nr:chemotaxis protein CheY [Herbiconiux oxytropis]MCS5723290.1 chemotaxis protein CheY [Herbiconiux oxytropis]MCS5727832.1 chemotaxis protein CheY [Herbiconiux oxytropis]
METTSAPTAAEARALLERAERLSRGAHDATRWPYIAFILALGVATSMGTFAMAVTTGRGFGLAYVGTLAVTFVLLIFFMISIRGRSAFARSRRWTAYIASWFASYAAALAVVIWAHGDVVLAGVASGIVLVVALVCAAWEARS